MKNVNLSSKAKELKALSIAVLVLSLLPWVLFIFLGFFTFIVAIASLVVTIIAAVWSYQLQQETANRVLASKFQLLFILFLIGVFISIVAFVGAIIYLASVDKMVQEENKYFAPNKSDLDQQS